MPTLSLLTAVHPARDEHLHETAVSVAATRKLAAQIGWTVEWIVVYDGPTEHATPAAAVDLVVVLPHHQGVSAARNVALRQAAGDWVIPLDGDDLLAPDGTAAVLTTVTAGWTATNRVLLTGHRTPHWIPASRNWGAGELAEHWTAPMLCHPNTVLAEHHLVTDAGGWPEHLDVNEDLAWLLTLSELSPGRFDPTVTLRYRVWDGQVVAGPSYPERKARAFTRIEQDINTIRRRHARRPIRCPTPGDAYGTMIAHRKESPL